MCKTTNSLRLVYFQVKKTKHLMATRKRAMCFCADYVKYSLPLSEEQFSVKKIVLTELWVVMSFYYSIKFRLSLSTQLQIVNHFYLVICWDLQLSVKPANSLTYLCRYVTKNPQQHLQIKKQLLEQIVQKHRWFRIFQLLLYTYTQIPNFACIHVLWKLLVGAHPLVYNSQ